MPSITIPSQRHIVRFYDPVLGAADAQGRTLSSILAWSDDELEHCHNYIQTLFPLPEPSPFNPAAPVISCGVFKAFRQDPALRNRLKEAFCRMLTFYGFKLHVDGVYECVVKGENFDLASNNWVKQYSHNHLRITRIIRCLRVLGLEKQAAAFFLVLEKLCQGSGRARRFSPISEKSRDFWTKAATRPLYMPLYDDDEVDAKSYEGFLWDFEKSRRVRGGENEDGPSASTNGREDSSEGSDKTDGAVAKAKKAKSSPECDSDAPAFSTRSRKRKRAAFDESE